MNAEPGGGCLVVLGVGGGVVLDGGDGATEWEGDGEVRVVWRGFASVGRTFASVG